MEFIKCFTLYLFDFDGLLVNTEHLHYLAYKEMLLKIGYRLDWSFLEYASYAHIEDDGIKNGVYAAFPALLQKEPEWEKLRVKKNEIYLELLKSGKVRMMPGAEKLLRYLEGKKARRCVVTNAKREQIEIIKKFQPVLDSLPHWVAREEYEKPKPNPECYLKAIGLYGQAGDKIVGFEDSLKGLRALMKTTAACVLVSQNPNMNIMGGSQGKNVIYLKSLEEFFSI